MELFSTLSVIRSNFSSVDYSKWTSWTPTVILKGLACLWYP